MESELCGARLSGETDPTAPVPDSFTKGKLDDDVAIVNIELDNELEQISKRYVEPKIYVEPKF